MSAPASLRLLDASARARLRAVPARDGRDIRDVQVPVAGPVPDVHVKVTGEGPHTVVLLHGFSDSMATWRRVIPALAVEHRVVAIDLPGHGRTARGWTEPLLEGYVEVVREVLDALGTAAPVGVLGNSMGAAVAATFAHRHPAEVDAAVLVGMPGVTGVPIAWRAAASRPASLVLRTSLRPVPLSQLRRGFGWIYSHVAGSAASIDPTAVLAYCENYVDRERLFGLSAIARALLTELGTAGLGRVVDELPMPVLQVWGRHDRLVPARGVQRDERRIVLPGCGHCPQVDAPDLLLDAALPVLRRGAHAEAA